MISILIVAQNTYSLYGFKNFILNIYYISTSTFILCLIYLFWLQIKNTFIENLRLNQEKTEHLKFKRNNKIFYSLLNEKQLVEPILLNKHSILFGNPKAKLTINAITNPLCGFCTKAFKSYHKLLENYPEEIKLNIIFKVPSENLSQQSSQIAQRVVELYDINKEQAFSALVNWFDVRDVKKWQTQFGLTNEKSELKTLRAHNEICISNKIAYTPATIVANCQYPKSYEIDEISFFIKDLMDIGIEKEPSVT